MDDHGISVDEAACMTGFGAAVVVAAIHEHWMLRTYAGAIMPDELWSLVCTALSGAFCNGLLVMGPAWLVGWLLFADGGIRRLRTSFAVPLGLSALIAGGAAVLIEANLRTTPNGEETFPTVPCIFVTWAAAAVVPLAILRLRAGLPAEITADRFAHGASVAGLLSTVIVATLVFSDAALSWPGGDSPWPWWAVAGGWGACVGVPWIAMFTLRPPGDPEWMRAPVPPLRVARGQVALLSVLLFLCSCFWVRFWFRCYPNLGWARTPLYICWWYALHGDPFALIEVLFQVIGCGMGAWFIAIALARRSRAGVAPP